MHIVRKRVKKESFWGLPVVFHNQQPEDVFLRGTIDHANQWLTIQALDINYRELNRVGIYRELLQEMGGAIVRLDRQYNNLTVHRLFGQDPYSADEPEWQYLGFDDSPEDGDDQWL